MLLYFSCRARMCIPTTTLTDSILGFCQRAFSPIGLLCGSRGFTAGFDGTLHCDALTLGGGWGKMSSAIISYASKAFPKTNKVGCKGKHFHPTLFCDLPLHFLWGPVIHPLYNVWVSKDCNFEYHRAVTKIHWAWNFTVICLKRVFIKNNEIFRRLYVYVGSMI